MKPLDHHNFSHAEMPCLSGILSGMALDNTTRLMTMPHHLRLWNLDPTGNWSTYKTVGAAGSSVTIDPWPSAGNGNIDDDSYAVDWKPNDIRRFSLVEQVIRPCGKPPLDGR